MSTAVKRACDACHRRKVKCDGISPCRNCGSAQLSCTYNAIPQKKGPKGSRAKVISELRDIQRQTSLIARIQHRMSGYGANLPNNNSASGPSAGMVTPEVVKSCLDYFFSNAYANMPIFSRQQLQDQSQFMEQNRDVYCLVTALCAFTMLQPGMTVPATDPQDFHIGADGTIAANALLLEEAMRVREGYEYLDSPTFNTVATSYLLFANYYGLEIHSKAWYYLREASTLMHMMDMHKEESYLRLDPAEASRRRRLYWLVLATERAYAIQRKRPITLQTTVNPPTMADDPSDPLAHELTPFLTLISAFRHFDDGLISTWNDAESQFNPALTKSLEKQLNDEVHSYLINDAQFNETSRNQQWLKDTVWQMSSHESPEFPYPLEMARQLVATWASHFPGQGAQLAGSGLIEKLAEVSHDAIIALNHKPASHDPFTKGFRQRLTEILNITAMLSNGHKHFAPLLFQKVTEALPRMISPMVVNPPESLMDRFANVDIFDGFGNAGMAQPPPQMQFNFEADFQNADYDRKFSIQAGMTSSPPDSNVGSTSSGNGVPLPQGTSPEIQQSFSASPPLLSPGVDFSQGLGDVSFNDMIMPHLGGQSTGGAHQSCAMPTLQSQSLNHQQMQAGGMPGNAISHHSAPNMGLAQGLPSGQNHGLVGPGQDMMGQKQQGHMSMMHGMAPPGGGGMMSQRPLPQAQRATYQMPTQHGGPPIPRTVGDFHALQGSFPS